MRIRLQFDDQVNDLDKSLEISGGSHTRSQHSPPYLASDESAQRLFPDPRGRAELLAEIEDPHKRAIAAQS